jgi:hypothetical protein
MSQPNKKVKRLSKVVNDDEEEDNGLHDEQGEEEEDGDQEDEEPEPELSKSHPFTAIVHALNSKLLVAEDSEFDIQPFMKRYEEHEPVIYEHMKKWFSNRKISKDAPPHKLPIVIYDKEMTFGRLLAFHTYLSLIKGLTLFWVFEGQIQNDIDTDSVYPKDKDKPQPLMMYVWLSKLPADYMLTMMQLDRALELEEEDE